MTFSTYVKYSDKLWMLLWVLSRKMIFLKRSNRFIGHNRHENGIEMESVAFDKRGAPYFLHLETRSNKATGK